ncbi:TonB-dependent receptor domain-containing protein [Novosphingobium piscinae]|uniref:TonB-dependent receptor n=1 Tax=Novosphingobium piscinae TaxID=1507448 RepID=A0A7X1FVF4_9SPHN|nr:TonB-dependent receptor [Novosphingobium piscinae]MBC2667584.1 TonB-dependent receptor [Novosphingobium piscinae]
MLPATAAAEESRPLTAFEASRTVDEDDTVTTGVARGRDRLSSATSTSAIKENEIIRLAPRSLAELFRNIPGIRVEAAAGEAQNNYTVRGLPMVNGASKYIQIQEDGLPVMEFGDLMRLTPDLFIRADFNVAQVESIRGGSASTFASNAPGGVINLISKTGEVEGGSIMVTSGIDFETIRSDFDFGGQLGGGWRFHIGGFYREGEGVRTTGFKAMRGGQLKMNVTRQFENGYIRFHAKILDDRVPTFTGTPLLVTGTNDNPVFADPAGLNSRTASLLSPNLPTVLTLNSAGAVRTRDFVDGVEVKALALGFEGQFSLGEWSITNRFRFADQSTRNTTLVPSAAAPAALFATRFGGAGAVFRYAAGTLAGQPFNTASGNGLVALSFFSDNDAPDVSNMTNDLRISRVWKVGGGNLTTTAGLYRSSQKFVSEIGFATFFQDVVGGGQAVPLNLFTAAGTAVTEGGYRNFGGPGAAGNIRDNNVTYQTTAPFASVNFAKGKIALGASVRWDNSRASGKIMNDRAVRQFDINADGVISAPERLVSFVPVGVTQPVNYRHDYLSYSVSVNYRVAEPFALFARYSLGARAAADKILFTAAMSPTTGALLNPGAGDDSVRQAEIGLKYRHEGLTLNLTGFHAKTDDTNSQISTNPVTGQLELNSVTRTYEAYGLEFEGGLRRGPFSVMAHATYTKAEIIRAENPALVGNIGRNQPHLLYGLTPQYDTDRFTFGANVIGTTGSFSQDVNQLRMPGYTTVGLFAQFRPKERLELGLNANNVFNTRAITGISEGTLPTSGVVMARPLFGRTLSASARVFF